jgi:catechol-2,3-dioxygenase
MTALGEVSAVGYVALRTRDLSASITHATDILGLRLTENDPSKAYFSARDTHHELVYTLSDTDGVDHFGLEVENRDELAAIREKVSRGGWKVISEQPIESAIDAGFAFVGPGEYTWHIYLSVSSHKLNSGGFGPDRFGHVTIKTPDSIAMRDFIISVLGFRLSEQIGQDSAFFLRCNNDHHGIAIMKAPDVAMHHYAWQTQSILDIARLGDRLARSGSRLAWGPVRHGAGSNIAGYYLDPSGGVVELYADLEQIFDREREAVVWSEEDLYWINQWDGHVPWPLLEAGLRPTER